MDDSRTPSPLKLSDVNETIRTFAQKYGRPPTAEELACLDYARKLLATTPAEDVGEARACEEMPSAASAPQESRTTEASG